LQPSYLTDVYIFIYKLLQFYMKVQK